eukprot:CAMPEP_0201547286 /NCGR_PEP_ID=MMETSP0173_2-20130828/3746_1 /ASSEMBLY_ACC=CAM_ASM_000268 /TAXON_ID=218659 /ORGANISM="Vexillifera sp., Strain DIVA3 564/2" /LENGTH=315 /DNA_ID=CAMNT_0047956285 /DNA_START=170 /DNA_END=1114 /DNA_ORIENTATION=-
MPEFEQVGDTLSKFGEKVNVARVDCDAESTVCSRFSVSGYPTLKYFNGHDDQEPEDYNGARTATEISEFIAQRAGIRLPQTVSAVKVLTDNNFDVEMERAFNNQAHVLVAFYAPWCGHCKQLAPTYEKLGLAFAGEERVVIAKFDADSDRMVPERYGVSGFPTIIAFTPNADLKTGQVDDQDIIKYSGARDLESLVAFVNTQSGTKRLADGSLNSSAGRIQALDDIATRFMQAMGDQNAQEALIQEAALLKFENAAQAFSAKVYFRAMDKIFQEGESYLSKETSRLQRMLDTGSISSKKADQFQQRINILESFLI